MDLRYDKDVISKLEIIWNFMKLDQEIRPCDIIMGCGCNNTNIPVRCCELFQEGYGQKILFAGGLGKITSQKFDKSEAEIYRDIALENDVSDDDILLEMKSTNTGDNFRFSRSIFKENHVRSVLIVHNTISERRTLATAQALVSSIKFIITSPRETFDVYLKQLQSDLSYFEREVSLVVGDIQRMIIYPQFGWQVEVFVPPEVIDAYCFLRDKGFNKYIYSSQDILDLIHKKRIHLGCAPNLFS